MKTWLYCETCKKYEERLITTSNNYSCNRCGGTLLTVDCSNIKTLSTGERNNANSSERGSKTMTKARREGMTEGEKQKTEVICDNHFSDKCKDCPDKTCYEEKQKCVN